MLYFLSPFGGGLSTLIPYAETEGNMREAIEMHLRGLEEDHLEIPVPRATATYVSAG